MLKMEDAGGGGGTLWEIMVVVQRWRDVEGGINSPRWWWSGLRQLS